ncbi:MAG: luciferase [Nocardia sp.]|uniref:LLM class flavin-dependent oxidoreductase n=1 Tax=Nocardia sp. TaxID=1821 RepID=UPI00261989B6|nr:LLM class flavin-dependent oxidoreductase [Nocardia sp.]MCU1642921.1 luciferase [Nocardia sp.]
MTIRFPLEFSLDTFGDRMADDQGLPLSHAQSIRDVVEQGVLAEQVNVDVFGIGEHHTDDFPMPAGDLVLATIAGRTERIRLGSAVTVLSSDDPVRVFQRFSTLHAVSNGRAEVILGRGSSIESFPLFGYNLADYDTLFDEKAHLFAQILYGGPVTWRGTTRPALTDQDIVPHTEVPLPTWIGVGGSPQSVIRAASLGYNLMLAIIGGHPARFAPFSILYRETLTRLGRDQLPIGVHGPGHIAATDELAFEQFAPRFHEMMRKVGPARGLRVPTEEQLRRDIGPDGALYVGSPDTVARKIATNLRNLDATRFNLKFGMGRMTQHEILTNIELYGTKVIPQVRELLAD